MSFIAAAIAIGAGATTATTVAAAGIGAGLLTTGLSASGALSSSPNYGNPAASSAAMADAQAANLPEMLRMQAAAQTGGSVINPGYIKQGNQYFKTDANGKPTGHAVSASKATTNFAGKSTADIQGAIQKALAAGQLENAKKYDSQFIAEQLAQEKQANPQGVQARSDLYNLVQDSVNNPPPPSPVAQTMDKQIGARVAAGSGLTPEEQAMLDASVNSSVTGTRGGKPDFSTALTTGAAGEQRALQNAGAGAAWLASGQTPADVQYREQQAVLGDLSSYISGQTPESQFSSLSGAQQGPTPNTGTNYSAAFNTNAGQQGAAAGVQQFGQQVQQQLNTPNPWTSGLSMALSATNAGIKSGIL